MLTATAREALWFLPFVAPIALWVAWSDMKFMKIPNKAVLALLAVFAVIGLIALPFETYAWRWSHVIILLVIGFVLSTVGLIGAGDAKFASPLAGFIAFEDWRIYLVLFSTILLGSFVAHRLMRAIPAVRRASPDWVSWTSKKFPMGLPLAGSLAAYLGLVAAYGQ